MSWRNSLLFLILLLALGGAVWFVLRQRNYDPSAATLTVQGGAATITRATTSKTETINTGGTTTINPSDILQADGTGSLNFGGTEIDLFPGVRLALKRYATRGSEAQIDLALLKGQILAKIAGYTDSASGLTLEAVGGTLATRGGASIAYIGKDQTTNFGVLYGSASVADGKQTVVLTGGQGTSLTDKALGDPTAWSPVTVVAFRASGADIKLPATLTNAKSGDNFPFSTGETFLVPPGQYDLALQTIAAYSAQGLTLKPGMMNNFPITLAEAIFNEVDGNGHALSAKGFTAKGDLTLSVTPNTPILISPGDMTLVLASDDAPDLVQPVRMNLEPGQTEIFSLRSDLFGGGKVKVDITPPPGITSPPMTISIYAPGNESGSPVQQFRSDGESQLLAPGDYLVVVPTQVTARYPITIAKNQDVDVPVQLGSLTVTFTDDKGQPSYPLIIVAAASEMKRLNLSLDKMPNTLYGIYFRAGPTTSVLLPAGDYMVGVNGRPDLSPQNVEIQAGKSLTVPIKSNG